MIEEAAFIGVMADETTDVSNKTQLGIHLRLSHRGMVVSRFGSFQSLPNTNANTLVTATGNFCKLRGIAMQRMHLGSDGASNFTGCHSGVAAQLEKKHPRMIHVHCVAHREALAAADAYKEVPYLKETFQPTLAGVFRFFIIPLYVNQHCIKFRCS